MNEPCAWCSAWPANYLNDKGEEICAECAEEALYDSIEDAEEET